MNQRNVRVRFAPSPTGPLHMGGVRTALYNYLFAKQHNGDFILRIEDTDQTRFVNGAEDYILEALRWCHIPPTEGQGVGGDYGPYRQSERKDRYATFAQDLIDSGHAYYAFDTAEDLENVRELAKKAGTANWQYNHVTRSQMKNSISLSASETQKRLDNGEPYVVRIKLPRDEEVKFEDRVRGWVAVNTRNMDDKVLLKADGMPTYHLANIVDDHQMKISHVIRGEEWLPSAPLHVLLYRYLGWEAERPEFAHLPLLLKPDGNGKLSKRDGDRLGFPVFPLDWHNPDNDEVFSGYREKGYFPEAFVNMLAFLGWNPGTEQEIFSIDELVSSFDLDRVNKAGARYDHDKTRWFNQQYLRKKSDNELGAALQRVVQSHGYECALDKATSVASLMKERAFFIKDMWEEGQYFFRSPDHYDEKAVRKKWKTEPVKHLKELRVRFAGAEKFTEEDLQTIFNDYLKEKETSFGQVGPVLRLALTGLSAGPSMFAISEIIGKQECLDRIDRALEKIGHG